MRKLLFLVLITCYQIAGLFNYEEQLYQKRIRLLISHIVQPEGGVDRKALKELQDLRSIIQNTARLNTETRKKFVLQLNLLIEQLPIASKILSYGYDLLAYKKIAENLKKQKNKYAQPLLQLKYKNFMVAFNAVKGEPQEEGFDSPNPYDAAYEEVVDNYINWAKKLQKLGLKASKESLQKLSDEFYTQFDRMLTRNAIGLEKKAQLITWLGGPENYLGVIMGKMIKQHQLEEVA